MVDFSQLSDSVIKGDREEVVKLTQGAIDEGIKPTDIINEGLINGMNVVGKRFKAGDMFVPEVLMTARAMKSGMNIVKPLLLKEETEDAGKVVLGTVSGDMHDIGKNLVRMMMEGGGLEVTDIGVDVDADQFVKSIKEVKPNVLAMSALLTTTMLEMKNVIEVLKEEGIREDIKIIVGGAPVTEDFADEIGADGYAQDAASAKDLVFKLIGGK